jgi:hypothetical protein
MLTKIQQLAIHPVFSNPVATFNNANFTMITTTSGSPRAYQVALKYAF